MKKTDASIHQELISKWHTNWELDALPFHRKKPHPYLLLCESLLPNPKDKNVLFPLCGKTVDMQWFFQQGADVTGVDISEIPLQTFFRNFKLDYSIDSNTFKPFTLYHHDKLNLFCGDFFLFPDVYSKSFDIIFDSGALVAIPPRLQKSYCEVIKRLLKDNGYYLVITANYDAISYDNAPYPIHLTQIYNLFSEFSIDILHHENNIETPAHLQKRQMQNLEKYFLIITK